MGTGVSCEKNQEFLQNFDFGGYSIRKTVIFDDFDMPARVRIWDLNLDLREKIGHNFDVFPS